ncbi:MAG: hypothetical protein ACP5E3_17610 [Bacteroidales bacterium]
MAENNEFANEMREKSNFDLQEIVRKYPDEDKSKVIAALQELKRRDVLYSEDQRLLEDLTEEGNSSSPENDRPKIVTPFSIFRDPNIVDDFNAPKLYSRFAIRFFAILFSTFFGGILLSINLNRLGKKWEIFYVMAFSILYSYGVFYVATLYPERSTTLTLILNLLGSLVLEEFFWKRYIGKHFKFRRQSIRGALLIGLGISILLIYTMMSGG